MIWTKGDAMTAAEPPRFDESYRDAHLPGDELEQVLQRRSSPRQRLMQGGGLVVALALFVAFLTNGHGPWDNRSSGATPSAEAYVQLRTLVTQGTLTINDVTVPFTAGRKYPLVRGGNLLTLDGEPLTEPKWCVIYWPDPKYSAYTCQHISFSADHRLVTADLGYSLADVNPDLLNNLNGSTQAAFVQATNAFTSANRLPTGAYYARWTDQTSHLPVVARAVMPLEASLRITFDSLSASDFGFSFDCTTVPCDLTNKQALRLQVPITPLWIYTSQGESVAQSEDPGGTSLPFTLRYTNNALQLAIPPDQPGYPSLDAYIRATILTAICLDPARPLLSLTGQSTIFSAVQTGPIGCTFRLAQINGSGNTIGDAGAYVVRFGVVLTADAPAHSLFPSLPVATPEDIAAVHT